MITTERSVYLPIRCRSETESKLRRRMTAGGLIQGPVWGFVFIFGRCRYYTIFHRIETHSDHECTKSKICKFQDCYLMGIRYLGAIETGAIWEGVYESYSMAT